MALIAVTGATGYIGGRLVPQLLLQGHQVRVLTRSAEKLRDVPWRDQVEVLEGELSDPQTAKELCEDAATVYFLVHSMASKGDFAALDEQCAAAVAEAATEKGLDRSPQLHTAGPAPDPVPIHPLFSAAAGPPAAWERS